MRSPPKVSNPLTVISVFAGITEVTGAAVLPALAESHQDTFVWFLVVFPFVLVTVFFVTLNFNHRVLYAPSDYSNEENFMRGLVPASAEQRLKKLKHERPSAVGAASDATAGSASTVGDREVSGRYGDVLLAEELVIHKLSDDMGLEFRRDVVLSQFDRNSIVDAVAIQNDGQPVVVEIKRLDKTGDPAQPIFDFIRDLERLRQEVSKAAGSGARVILAIVVDQSEEVPSIKSTVQQIVQTKNLSLEVRVFSLEELQDRYL